MEFAFPEHKPRVKRNADKPGNYELVTRVIKTVIDPGETIEIEQYITGYGQISGAKMVMFPSAELFNEKKSFVEWGFGQTSPGWLGFGTERQPIGNYGCAFEFGAVGNEHWGEPTMFIDALEDPKLNSIITEKKFNNAPIYYSLTTKQNIYPGKYYIDTVFTYFDGSIWKSSKAQLVFKVRNVFERNESITIVIVLLAAISTVVPFLLKYIPILKEFLVYGYFK